MRPVRSPSLYAIGPLRRLVRGWVQAQAFARTDAAARHAAVPVWTVTHRGTRWTLKCTIFPDGSEARPEVLHRMPRGFGL
jgi:hypothetical protein